MPRKSLALTTSTQQHFPINDLPIELQQEIFTIAAKTDLGRATRIALVSQRVCAWVEPNIYSMVTLGPREAALFLRTIRSKPRQFFATHVKRLCLFFGVNASEAAGIIGACAGVRELAFWVAGFTRIHSTISRLPLRRLSIEFSHFVELLKQSTDLGHHAWSRELTHLDIIFSSGDELPPIPGVDGLPSLTHLSLWNSIGKSFKTSIASILSKRNLLYVLLICIGRIPSDQDTFGDPRVVYLSRPDVARDWEAPVRGLPDMWSRAEEIVRGQIRNAEFVD